VLEQVSEPAAAARLNEEADVYVHHDPQKAARSVNDDPDHWIVCSIRILSWLKGSSSPFSLLPVPALRLPHAAVVFRRHQPRTAASPGALRIMKRPR
jgi:hypothetical protein